MHDNVNKMLENFYVLYLYFTIMDILRDTVLLKYSPDKCDR